MHLSAEDHDRVTAAVTAAEAHTDGEIVTIVARQSDAYHDVALQWSVLAMVVTLALLAVFPAPVAALHARVFDAWSGPQTGHLLAIAAVLATLAYLLCRLAMAWRPLRLLLTPAATKTRRVRRRALMLFRTGAEKRTVAATGVLLYLSLDEHRAELIADESIHAKVPQETWGAAMAALVVAVKDGRPGDGMADAVAQIGVVLAEHFPRGEHDVNELPDRLIEL